MAEEDKKYGVSLRVRQLDDFNHSLRKAIVVALPGKTKVKCRELNNMIDGEVITFKFKKAATAEKFAKRIFDSSGSKIDVKPELDAKETKMKE